MDGPEMGNFGPKWDGPEMGRPEMVRPEMMGPKWGWSINDVTVFENQSKYRICFHFDICHLLRLICLAALFDYKL